MSNTNNFNFGQTVLQGLATSLGGLPGSIVGSGINGAINQLFGNYAARQQFKYQSRLQQQQFDLQKQMFDYTSAYNSPVNAVQRYKDAGLNPNLLTGQTQQSGTTGSVGQGQAGLRQVQVHSDLAQHAQLAMLSKKLDSEINMNNSQADYYKHQAVTAYLKNITERERSKLAREFANEELRKLRVNNDLAGIKGVESANRAELYKFQAQTEIERAYNINAHTALLIKQGITEDMKPALIASEIAKNNAEVSYKKALASVTAYQINVMIAEIGEKNARAFLNMEQMKWQALRNGDYEKFTQAELDKIASEVDRNYKHQSNSGFEFHLGPNGITIGHYGNQMHNYKPK